MTQVKEWSNQELNRALAVLMGWKTGGDPNKQRDFVWWIDDHRFRLPEKWDPCTDHAASLEVQTAACKVSREAFTRNLMVAKWKVKAEDAANWGQLTMHEIGDLFLASPRERVEAAYITLSSKQ